MPVVAQARRGAHQVAGVGGVGDGTRHGLLDASLDEGWDTHGRIVDALLEHVVVLAGEVEMESPVDAVRAVGTAAGHLVGTDQQAIDLAAVVARGAGVAHHGRLEPEVDHGLQRLGHQVLVDDRHDGHVEADHGPELGGVVPGGVDHVLAHDPVAVVGIRGAARAVGRGNGSPSAHRAVGSCRRRACGGGPGSRVGGRPEPWRWCSPTGRSSRRWACRSRASRRSGPRAAGGGDGSRRCRSGGTRCRSG